MKKSHFLVRPFLVPVTILFELFLFTPCIYFIIEIINKGAYFWFFGILLMLFLIIPVGLAIIYSFRKIEVYDDRIIEKNLFAKIKNQCYMKDIVEISTETYIKDGTYYVLKDARPPKSSSWYDYVRFHKNKKSVSVIRDILDAMNISNTYNDRLTEQNDNKKLSKGQFFC